MIRTDSTTAAKTISYDRLTHDYAASYEGNYIGSFASYFEAERELDHYVSGLMRQTAIGVHVGGVDAAAEVATDAPLLVEREVVENPGLHLSSYTVYDRAGQSSGSYAVHLCDACAAKRRADGTMAAKWSGECINGYCDDCQAGPSVSHYRLVEDNPPVSNPGPLPSDDRKCRACGEPHLAQRCPAIRARLFAPAPIVATDLLAEADAVLLAHHLQSFNAAYCLANGIITPVQLATWGS